jgi:hypothetical protein
MARMASRPKYAKVWYRGIPYSLDLVRCRRALVNRQVDGDLDSMQSLADAVVISRSTASRFFSGRPTSLAVTLKILDALHLTFADVAHPMDGDDEADGGSVIGAVRPRAPRPGGSAPVDATHNPQRRAG